MVGKVNFKPSNGKVYVGVRIDKDLKRKLQRKAKEDRRTLAAVLEIAARRYVEL